MEVQLWGERFHAGEVNLLFFSGDQRMTVFFFLQTGLDVKSGQSCKMSLEKFTNIFGVFRPISAAGVVELEMALGEGNSLFIVYAKMKICITISHQNPFLIGVPADIAQKLATEFDARMSVKEKCGLINFSYDSKYQPMNATYKWGEEYKLQVPGMPGETCTVSKSHILSAGLTFLSFFPVQRIFSRCLTFLQVSVTLNRSEIFFPLAVHGHPPGRHRHRRHEGFQGHPHHHSQVHRQLCHCCEE